MVLTPNPDDYVALQRGLRRRLLNQSAVPWAEGRDLAAHLLLNLDDLQASWRCTIEWLSRYLSCARADGGAACPADLVYRPGACEVFDENTAIASLKGVMVDNRHAGMQRLWHTRRTLACEEVSQETRFSSQLREDLVAAGTHRKLARSLWDGKRALGLVCIDRVADQSAWEQRVYERFESACVDVVEPVLGAAFRLRDDALAICVKVDETSRTLTPAEQEVALLARDGLRYKQIASQLGRSFSTVDHQLRSIRQKLGVKNHAALVRVLAHREFSR